MLIQDKVFEKLCILSTCSSLYISSRPRSDIKLSKKPFRCFVHSYDGRCFGSFTDALPTNLTDNFYYIVLARLRKCSLCENNADSPTKPLPARTLLFVLTSHGKGEAEAQSMNSTTVCKNLTKLTW